MGELSKVAGKIENSGFNSFGKTEELFNLIEKILASDRVSRESFLVDGYDFWSINSKAIFENCRSFIDGHYIDESKNSFLGELKIFLTGCVLLFLSLFSVLIAVFKRPKYAIYSLDRKTGFSSDVRLDNLYNKFYAKDVDFFEFLKTIPSSNNIKRFFSRRRKVFYIDSIDFLTYFFYKLFSKSKFTLSKEAEKNLPEEYRDFTFKIFEIYHRKALSSKFKIKFLKFIVKIIGLKKVLSIDETHVRFAELSIAANLNNAEFYAIQHGHYHRFSLYGFRRGLGENLPIKFLTWSDFWKSEFLRIVPTINSSDIIVAGSLNSVGFGEIDRKNINNQIKTILVPYEASIEKDLAPKIIKNIIQCSDFRIIFKIRKDRDMHEQVGVYSINNGQKNIIVTDDTKSAIASSDISLGVYSSFLYDCGTSGLPVVIVKPGNGYYAETMVERGVSELLDVSDDNFCQKLNSIYEKREVYATKSKDMLGEVKNIDEFLDKLIN